MNLIREIITSAIAVSVLVIIMSLSFGLGFEMFCYVSTYLFIIFASIIMGTLISTFD